MSRGPIGRDQELPDLVATLATAAAGDGQIVEVVGDAGIGKSTLLDALVARAVVEGARVWRHAPTRPEIGLPWSGLAALVANATESELARMSPPARRGVPRRHGVVVLARRSGEAWALESDRTGITLRRAELELVHRRIGGRCTQWKSPGSWLRAPCRRRHGAAHRSGQRSEAGSTHFRRQRLRCCAPPHCLRCRGSICSPRRCRKSTCSPPARLPKYLAS